MRLLAPGRTAVLTGLLLAIAACDEAVAPEPEAEPLDRILFLSTRDDPGTSPTPDRTIYRVNVDGTGVEPLSSTPAQYAELDLSPDRARLAFTADLSGCQNIWSMRVDGSDLTQLTGTETASRCNKGPRWSPDGEMIAFHSTDDVELGWEVHVMNADGSDRMNVTNNPSTDAGTNMDLVHGWSPDGRLVIYSNRGGTTGTYVMNPDGTELEPLFDDPAFLSPYWSSDGARMAAVRAGDDGYQVHVMDADGTMVAVEHDPGDFDSLATWADPWSPDESRLAFGRRPPGGDLDIWVVNADGTGLTPVTDAPGDALFNGWSPDGTRILFTSDRDGSRDIYVSNVDGTDLINLTETAADDSNAIWLPID